MYFLEAIKTSDVILFTSNGENHTTGELSQLQNLIETGRSPNIPHTEGGQTLGVFR